MKIRCPQKHCDANSKNKLIAKDGLFWRSSDSRWVQRYVCKKCGKKFSQATFDPAYGQNKRRINYPLFKLLSSGMSMRRSALILNVSRRTIERRIPFLGQLARRNFFSFWEQQPLVREFQFDDLITIEHTKCKPLSVTMAVEKESRKIIGIEVSRMPAFGHLAAISKKKYGPREDQRKQGIENLFSKIKPFICEKPTIFSDNHKFYPPKIKKHFPCSQHKTTAGGRGCIAGQGELKKLLFDPLFSINHSFAMLRANINRLIRRTWCTTKKPERLLDHLYIYATFHNGILIC